MSEKRLGEYMKRLEKEPSAITRGHVMMEAAKDEELTTRELVWLDNWFRRICRERERKRG